MDNINYIYFSHDGGVKGFDNVPVKLTVNDSGKINAEINYNNSIFNFFNLDNIKTSKPDIANLNKLVGEKYYFPAMTIQYKNTGNKSFNKGVIGTFIRDVNDNTKINFVEDGGITLEDVTSVSYNQNS